MRIVALIIIISGILMALGGAAGLINGNAGGAVRLIIGIILIAIAVAVVPKKNREENS